MKNKFRRDPMMVFLLRFVLIFALLIFPWPGWNSVYGQYFRQLGQAFFGGDEGKRVVLFFKNNDAAGSSGLDTKMTLGNRDLIDATGKGMVKTTGINTRSVGWMPTVMTVSLILATPVPWRRRFRALVGGLALVQVFILFSLQAWIWNNSPDVALFTLSNFWKEAADDLDYTLINQIGVSFSVPVIIWIFVTFRRQDAAN